MANILKERTIAVNNKVLIRSLILIF